jgi:peptidoglycan/xylan/chitin deacetylase (PgdA/CDA1 family)
VKEKKSGSIRSIVVLLSIIVCVLFAVEIVSSFVTLRQLDGIRSDNARVQSELSEQKNENKKMRSQLDSLASATSGLQSQVAKIQQTRAKMGKNKVAYLTYDDGPSNITPALLDALKANGVHATFFVVGTAAQNHPDVIKRAVAEGNVIGIHSWTHDYKYIYSNETNFFEDFNKLKDYITTLTGIAPTVNRYPGGTSETAGNPNRILRTVDPKVKAMGFKPFDWNAYAKDAVAGYRPSVEQTAQNVMSTAGPNTLVILSHDTGVNGNDVAALPLIVKGLRERGYSFGTLSTSTPKVQWNPA